MEIFRKSTLDPFVSSFIVFLYGCLLWAIVLMFVVLTSPIFVYRALLSLLASCFNRQIGNMVSLGGAGVATDFLKEKIKASSRDAVVVNMIFEGTITMAEIQAKMESRWFSAVDNRGKKLYPEFQQFIDYWMGFMFWKRDNNFRIQNHLKLHRLQENASDEDSESFVCHLVEKLLNKSFVLGRSPWEAHVVQNYTNQAIKEEPMTMILLRFHHSMADAPAYLAAVGDGLLNSKMVDMQLALPTPPKYHLKDIPKIIKRLPKIAIQMIFDISFVASLFHRLDTHFSVPNKIKTYKQIYGRSKCIPVKEIKQIKGSFKTSFSSVLLSSVSAGIGSFLNMPHLQTKQHDKSIAVGIPIPKRNHATKLGVDSTATIVDLPVSANLTTKERLMMCQQLLEASGKSTIPIIMSILERIVLSMPASMARYLYYNRMCPAYFTTFPGPTSEIRWHGKNILVGGDYAAGGLIGIAGVGFVILSFANHVRIAVTAEAAVLDRNDVRKLIGVIETEINDLYCMSVDQNNI